MSKVKENLDNRIEKLIIKGNLPGALNILYDSVQERNFYNAQEEGFKKNEPLNIWNSIEKKNIILLFFRYKNHTNDYHEGLITYDQYSTIKNQIVFSTLQLINSKTEIEDKVIGSEEGGNKFIDSSIRTQKGQCKIIPLIPKLITGSVIQRFDEIDDKDFEYISVHKNYHSNELYAFKIIGESMNPIREGMVIIGEPIFRWYQIESGDRYVLITNEESMFKRVINYDSTNFLLISDHSDFKEQFLEKKEVNLIFKCVDILSEEQIVYLHKKEKVSSLWKELQGYLIRNRL